jgi:hypothetical protein
MKSMGIFPFIVYLIASLIVTGCATVKDLHQEFIESLRKPGENMENGPVETLQSYRSCTERSMPVLLESEIVPERIVPGKEINLRIRYATCLAASSSPRKGEIIRAVYYKDHMVFHDRTKYTFKPGTWTVDAFIKLPDDAKPGTYTVDSTVIYREKPVKRTNTFEVKNIREGT